MIHLIKAAIYFLIFIAVITWFVIDEEKKWQKRKREMYEDFKAWPEMEGRI